MARWRWHGPIANGALVLAVGLVSVVGLVVQSRGVDTAAEWLALPVVLAATGALLLRRRYPVTVGVAALVAVAAYGQLLHRPGPVMLVFVVALYTVVDEGRLAVAIGLGTASVVAFAVADGFYRDPDGGNGATLLHAGWLVAVIVGVTRNRRAYLAEAEAHALAAERRAAAEARRRATEERLRIARELHDALGHHLSLINVQASAALHRPDPERSRQALAAIKQTSRETLRELRATLDLLRRDDAATDGGVGGAAGGGIDAPGLGRLAELVATAGAAGASGPEIRTEVTSTPPLPPEVDRAAYRIVQEALTNVTRHAAARTAVVRVRPDGDDLLVEVEDDGAGTPGAAGAGAEVAGTGIRGMRERARALGGSLTAGPRPGGGFRVHARLPLRRGSARAEAERSGPVPPESLTTQSAPTGFASTESAPAAEASA